MLGDVFREVPQLYKAWWFLHQPSVPEVSRGGPGPALTPYSRPKARARGQEQRPHTGDLLWPQFSHL